MTHIAILNEGVDVWNAWRDKHPVTAPILRTSNFRGKMLRGANLRNADLSGSDLRDANLRKADLSSSNLRGTKLHRAFFSGANLRGAMFKGARFYETVIANADLREALELDECIHLGPSTLDHRTLLRCRTLPTEFLQGCGLPDVLIKIAKTSSEVEYASCFISYSSADEPFVVRLHRDLQRHGVRCWFAPKDLKIGDKIRTSIDGGIRSREKLLVVLSAASSTSPWVEKEVETAFEEERRRKAPVLFPIRLDDAAFTVDQGWVADIRRSRHVGDFRDWERGNAYKEALERLLRGLRQSAAEEPGA